MKLIWKLRAMFITLRCRIIRRRKVEWVTTPHHIDADGIIHVDFD